MSGAGIIVIFWLIGFILGIVIFIYSLIFIIKVPKEISRLANAAERIAYDLEVRNYNQNNF